MAYTISISDQPNNSLGDCWLCKFEDDFTGALFEKCVYPKSDFEAIDAFNAFVADYVRDDEIDVDGIYLLDSAKDDPELASLAMVYKAKFGIEYRNMHTALHGIIVFDDEGTAKACSEIFDALEDGHDDEPAINEAFKAATDHYEEIDFRDIEDISLANGDFWRYYDDDAHGVLLVNDIAYDLYI